MLAWLTKRESFIKLGGMVPGAIAMSVLGAAELANLTQGGTVTVAE